MTGLAADAHLGPRRSILLRGNVVALHDVRAVAVETVLVPDLADVVGAVGNWRDLLPVHPSLAGDVPEHRQYVNAALGQRREIPLIAFGAERVIDRKCFRRAIAERDGDEWLAGLHTKRVRPIVIGELRPVAKIASDGGFGDGLRHLDVQGILPLRMFDVVTFGARLRAEVAAGRGLRA